MNMKGITLLYTLLVCTAAVLAFVNEGQDQGGKKFLPNGCPVDPHIHWLLPHEEECTLFYYCVWGELVLRECSPGTHFNSLLQVCDWPHDAGCTKTPNPTRPEPTTPEPTIPEPTTPEPTTPEPTTPEPTTPEPTTSKPTTIKPTTPEPTTPAPTPEETAATTAAPTPAPPTEFLPNGCPVDPHIHWLLPHEEECTLFYYCVWGELVLRECSPGTHFNSVLQVCDWPYDAGCTKTPKPTEPEPTTPEPTTPEPTTPEPITSEPTTPKPTSEPTTLAPTPEQTAATTAAPTPAPPTEFLPNGCPVDPHIHWLLPHEEECTLFYYCVWGELVLRECSPGTHFNSVLQVCDWPHDAGCTKTPNPTRPEPTTPEPTTPEPTTPEPTTPEPTTPEPTTPEPTTSKPTTIKPTTPEPTTPAPTPEETAATTAAPTPAPPTEFLPNGCPVDPHIHWLLPHEEECTLFYYCVWGELVLRECSPGTHFNSVLQVCDWPHDAGCTKTPNPTRPELSTPEPTTPEPKTPEPTTLEPTTSEPTTIKPTTPEPTTPAPTPEPTATPTATPTPAPPTEFLPNGCPVDPHIHWLLPHEEECTLFYYCVWGELLLRECSPGTHFNSVLQVCDWPYDAGCTKAPKPTEPEPTTPEPTTPEPITSEPTTPKPTTPEPTTPALTIEPTATPTTTPTPAPPTEFLPNGCPVDPHIHWLLPHEEECTLFYYCFWGELVLRECSPGTHFNSVLQICDWPHDAGCTTALNKHINDTHTLLSA